MRRRWARRVGTGAAAVLVALLACVHAAPAARPDPVVASDPSAGDPYVPGLGNRGYDVTRYTVRIALDPATPRLLDANVTIAGASERAGLSRVSFDFVGFDVKSVAADGKAATFRRDPKKLWVDLPRPLAVGGTFSIDVAYSGAPATESSAFVPFLPHLGLEFETGNAYVVSEPDGARTWFPCNDHPRDKAAFEIVVSVPAGKVAVANGKLTDGPKRVSKGLPDGRDADVFTWTHDAPMATYLVTVAAGDYVRLESQSPKGVHLRSYVFPGQRKSFERMMPAVGEAIDWMAERFGPYPFPEFGYVQVSGMSASLETQTMVVLGSPQESTAVHEMAHQWFGDWVSLDSWADVWRNEGFARYVETLWSGRSDPAELDRRLDAAIAAVPRTRVRIGNPPPGELFGNDVYAKGALLAHALRRKLGDDAFFRGLRAYFAKYGGRAATRDQFRAELEAAGGGKSLAGVFDAWLK